MTKRMAGDEMGCEKLLHRIEFVLGKSKIGVDIIDSDYNVRYIDPAWRKVYGDPTGKKCYQYFMRRHDACPRCGVRSALLTKKITVTEERLAREGDRPVQVTTVPFKDDNGDWLVAETNVDISGLKEIEKSLKASEEKFRVIADRNPVGIGMTYGKTVLYVNKSFADILGYKVSEVIGSDVLDFLAPCDRRSFAIKIRRRLMGEKFPNDYKVKGLTKDGRQIGVEVRSGPAVNVDGRPAIIATFQDVTKREKAEAILKRDKSELERLVKQGSTDLLASQEKMHRVRRLADIGRLAATVAHEIRTPLAAIRIAAFNISKKNKNKLLKNNIENIERKVLEADQIIKNLLLYSSIKEPIRETIDLCELLKESIELSRAMYHDYDVTVRNECKYRRGITIDADPVQIKEVFSNILNNAYQSFKNKKGRVDITTRTHKGEYFNIQFKDNGPGMGSEVLKHILEPFVSTKSTGTGLGLPVCSQIMTLHGGYMNISSSLGRGTKINLYFPLNRKISLSGK